MNDGQTVGCMGWEQCVHTRPGMVAFNLTHNLHLPYVIRAMRCRPLLLNCFFGDLAQRPTTLSRNPYVFILTARSYHQISYGYPDLSEKVSFIVSRFSEVYRTSEMDLNDSPKTFFAFKTHCSTMWLDLGNRRRRSLTRTNWYASLV